MFTFTHVLHKIGFVRRFENVLSLADVLNIMSVPGSRKFATIASNVLLFVDYFRHGVHHLSVGAPLFVVWRIKLGGQPFVGFPQIFLV